MQELKDFLASRSAMQRPQQHTSFPGDPMIARERPPHKRERCSVPMQR
jgi:hypothetical protein